jgi:hypothetical protein
MWDADWRLQLARLIDCETVLPELVAALENLLPQIDTEDSGLCRWCGRDMNHPLIDGGLCPSDDCPGHVARALLARVKEKK